MIFKDLETIVFAGDSITDANKVPPFGEDGSGDALGNGYVRTIRDMLMATYPQIRLRILNSGVSGNTSKDLLQRWENDVLNQNPDWVSICIGVNDSINKFLYPTRPELQVTHDEYSQNLENMVTSLSGKVKGIFLISPYIAEPNPNDPLRQDMDKYRAICKETAEKHNCVYIDIQKMFDEYFLTTHQLRVAWDRIHPFRVGAYLIAREFLKHVDFNYYGEEN